MLNERGEPEGESRYSWTIDFAARRAKAREEMQPLLDEAAEIKTTVVKLKERLKCLKKEKADKETLAPLDVEIKEKNKAACDLEAKAADIDVAVFDLKAVNPNIITKVDTRTPQEIITNIEEQGQVVSEALARLTALLAKTDV